MVKLKFLQSIASPSRGPPPDQQRECARIAEENSQLIGKRMALFFIMALFLLTQACLSTTQYSGYQKPPMFGDFEAQRHWMEITVNLPPGEWYFNSSANDLDYWGLDYPPLTAYHSWLLGKIAHWLDPSWVRLYQSHGLENPLQKLFMRLTVIATMMTIYTLPLFHLLFTGVVKEGKTAASKNSIDKAFRFLGVALLYPGLLFVDCSHFQYNHISLGFFLWAVACLEKGHFSAGSALFVCALNHKQMELYHALPIATFLFVRSIHQDNFPSIGPYSLLVTLFYTSKKSLLNLLVSAGVVLGSFTLIWLPFLWPDPSRAFQVFHRIFPFYRGLFEDKVANFWCCASILVKFKQLYSVEMLIKSSICLVLLACIPSLLCLFYRPNKANFRAALTSNALAFFLFSFQVHEKSILLAAIPALLLLPNEKLQRPTAIFLSASAFSLYPLCLKDGAGEVLPLFLAYPFILNVTLQHYKLHSNVDLMYNFLGSLTTASATSICLLQLMVTPPARFPDLFPMLNALFSFGVFSLFWLFLNVEMVAWNLAVFRQNQRSENINKGSKRKHKKL